MDQIQNLLQNRILKAAEEQIDAEYGYSVYFFIRLTVK